MTRQSATPSTLSVRVPFAVRKRGGRKLVISPDGVDGTQRPRVDNAIVKALARAFRWRKMLESGEFATITELAKHENMAFTYMSRVLRLSLLAPDIVEAILEGRQPAALTLYIALQRVPLEWEAQRDHFRLDPASPAV